MYVYVSFPVPVPMFEMTMYTVPENLGSSVPLCVDIGVEITENLIYTINAEQKDPPEAQGEYTFT